jgi:hypothetical protein
MTSQCHLCGSNELCTSRLRLKDIPHLLRLHYPMRCWVCRNREYVPLFRMSKGDRNGGPQRAEVQ